MTTGNGEGGNEIEIRVNVTPGGDVQDVARQQGQQFNEAFGEAVGKGAVPLPPIDGAAAVSQINDLAGQIEARLQRATGDLGLRMQEALTVNPAVAVDQPFRNLTEAATAYREELRQVGVQLEQVTRGNVFGRGITGDTGALLERGIAELRRNIAQGHLDQSTILSEEARQAIEGGQVRLPNIEDYRASTVAALRTQQAAAPTSDVQQAVQRAQADLQRVMVDGAAYSFRDGSWAKLTAGGAARGAVEDPAILAQLNRVAQTTVDGAVRAQLDSIAQRDPNFSRFGLAAGTDYGPYGVPSHEVLGEISKTPNTVEGMSGLIESLQLFAGETTQLSVALDVARGNILRLADESSAYAENTERSARAERDASDAAAGYEARLQQLTAAFHDQDAALAARETAAAKNLLAGAQERAEGTYGQNLAYGTYGPNIAASAAAQRDAEASARETQLGRAMIVRAQEAAYSTYGPNLQAGGAGGSGRLPPGVGAVSPEDPDWARRFAAAIKDAQTAAETAVPGFEKLAGVIQLTEEQMRTIFATGQLPVRVGQEAEAAGTAGVVKTPGGQLFGYNAKSGEIQGTISAEEALTRVDAQLAASQGGVAAALTTTGQAARLTREELDQLKAQQGLVQRFMGAAFGGDVGDGGHGGVNAFKRTAGDNAEFLGAITRYQIAYAGIFAISRGLSALVNDTTESQVAIIHLSEALGEGSDAATRYAASLGDVAEVAGTSVVAAMEAATRGIFAFRDEGQTPDQRREIGTVSARTSAVAHVIAGGDANQVQGELIATTRDFGGAAADQIRVLDAATNAFHNYGAAIGDVLQSLPIVGQQAHQAGLSIEETANYVALIESRTGQGGTAAGTALARILQSVQKPEFNKALIGVGVDTSTTQASQIQQLAVKWDDLTVAQQDNFSQLAVGSRGAGAFLAIMTEGTGILEANKRSYDELGASQRLFFLTQNTLGGLLRRLGTDLQSIGLDLARSGVLDFVGVIAHILDPLLHGVDDLLRLFDLIPGAIRPWVTGLAEVLAVLVLIGRQQAVNNAETVAGAGASTGGVMGFFRRAPVVAPVAEEASVVGTSEEAALMSGAEVGGGAAIASRTLGARAAGVGASAAAGLTRLGGALLGPVGVVAGIVALTAAVGATIDAFKAEHAARKEAEAAQKQFSQASTVDQLRSAASALANAAVTQEHANSRFFGIAASSSDRARVETLHQQALLANNLAAAFQSEQITTAHTGGLSEFFTTQADDSVAALNNGLTNMEQAGVPAVRMLHLLTQAIDLVGGSSSDAIAPVLGNVGFRGKVIAATQRGIYASGSDVSYDDINQPALSDILLGKGGPNIPLKGSEIAFAANRAGPDQGSLSNLGTSLWEGWAKDAVQQIANPAAIGEAVQSAMATSGVGPDTVITPKLEREIADKTVALLGLDDVISGKSLARLRTRIETTVGAIPTNAPSGLPKFKGQDDFNRFVLGDAKTKTPGSLDSIDQYLQLFNDPRQADAGIGSAKAEIGVYQHLANQGFGGIAQAEVLSRLHAAQDNYVKLQIAQAERLRQAALADANGSLGGQLVANANAVISEIKTAAKYGDVSAVIGIIATADDATIAAVRQHLHHDYEIAKAAYDADLAILQDLQSLPAGIRNTDPIAQDQVAAAQRVLAKADKAVKAALAPLKALLHAFDKGAITTDDAAAAALDPRSIDIARIQAGATPGSALSAATVALQVAQYQKAHAKNQQEYWEAVKAINDAEYQLLGATLDYMHQARLNNIDLTDPVAVAKEDARAARDKLNADLARGAGRDTIATDRNDVTTTRNARQKAAFDQRLHDTQIAHDLGELSDAAYLRFLDRQHDRLKSIQHKTRQQYEELQQIDEAIKAASDQFQGQWNLGDIHVPTAYEARRYVASQAASSSANYQSTSTSHVNITIHDQTSDQKVRKIIRETVGNGPHGRLTSNPPKVTR